ncbi:MAG: exopolysaccharide transport family protein [Alphaproteobacteria bacterium]|nr:exopolysaccharide transport family protein [Alphaproteobacteria bacterium]
MRHQSQASPDDIDLTTLGSSLRRNATRLIFLSLIAGALTYLALSMIAPRYLAQSELGIVAKATSNPFTAPGSQAGGSDQSVKMDEKAINTHIRAIQSTDLIEKVATQLRLSGRAEFNPVLGPVDTFSGILRSIGLSSPQTDISESDRTLNEVLKRLVVFTPEQSRAITINFTSINPQLAADFANGLANAYREKLASQTVAEATAVQKTLSPRIAKLAEEVSDAAGKVAKFRNKAGLLRGGTQKTPINEQQLGDITTELTKVNSQRTAAEARARTARDMMRRGSPEIIPEVQRSPLIQNLISQRVSVERELLKRSASLKSAHPVIKQLRADLRAVNRQIAGEVANVVSSIDKEAYVAAEQEKAVRASLEKLKSKVAVNTTDEVKLRRLEAIAASKRSELERLQAQFEANRASTENGVVPVEAQIITLARPPSVAVFPRKLPYTLLVMIATLLLGTALVITSGLARGARTQQPEDHDRLRDEIAAAAAQAPPPPDKVDAKSTLASRIPRPSPKIDTGHTMAANDDGFARFTNPTELARHLLASSENSTTGFRSLIATRLDRTATANMVVEAASSLTRADQQTLLIDWSLEGAGIARELQLPNNPGFIELLHGTANFADVVRWVPGSQVHFISSGRAIAEGPEGLDADQLNLILDALDEAYDHIVIIGQYEAARSLFETIQGRFDAGIVADEKGASGKVLTDPPDTFLGFEVADIDLIRFEGTSEA